MEQGSRSSRPFFLQQDYYRDCIRILNLLEYLEKNLNI
jgi:hypothetical protein